MRYKCRRCNDKITRHAGGSVHPICNVNMGDKVCTSSPVKENTAIWSDNEDTKRLDKKTVDIATRSIQTRNASFESSPLKQMTRSCCAFSITSEFGFFSSSVWMFWKVISYFTRIGLKKPNVQDISLEECNRHSGFMVVKTYYSCFL